MHATGDTDARKKREHVFQQLQEMSCFHELKRQDELRFDLFHGVSARDTLVAEADGRPFPLSFLHFQVSHQPTNHHEF